MSTVGLARILSIGQPAISRSVQRGEKMAETVYFAHQFLVIMKYRMFPKTGYPPRYFESVCCEIGQLMRMIILRS